MVSFNAARRLKKGAEVHPFMSPENMMDGDDQKQLPPGSDGLQQNNRPTQIAQSTRNDDEPSSAKKLIGSVMGKVAQS